jgi:AraC family transcriptional regulator of adaptative response / DNA-3-methyladenine glycosylase II
VPGLERLDGRAYRRAVRTSDGEGVVLELTSDRHEDAVHLRVAEAGADPRTLERLARTARRLFDLDADPAAIDVALSADPALAPLVAATPGIRVPGADDGFELAVRAIVGQQVSVAAARTTLGGIVARLGTPLPHGSGGVTHLFPTPAAVASASGEDLRGPAARAEAIRELARRVDAGVLLLDADADADAARVELGSIPGVGAWTVGYVAMRALGDPDAFPTGDLGVRHGVAALGLADDRRSIADRAERWRPWRAYAAMHLWNVEV